MRSRIAALIVLLAACSPRSHADDPVVGKWGDANGKAFFELRSDGSLDKPPTVDTRCERDEREAAWIAACAARQTWDHDGSTVTLRMAVISQTVAYTTAHMMHTEIPKQRCACNFDPIEVEYRDGALVVGKERAVRIRERR